MGPWGTNNILDPSLRWDDAKECWDDVKGCWDDVKGCWNKVNRNWSNTTRHPGLDPGSRRVMGPWGDKQHSGSQPSLG